MSLKSFIKKVLKLSPIPLSKNHGYDLMTNKILRKVLGPKSNCIDVGCHKGEILDLILKYSPKGIHHGFEPIPMLYENLVTKYSDKSNCIISSVAASNEKGESTFNYVVSNPSYSGLKKRSYDNKNEKDMVIQVRTEKLDELIPNDIKIELIKVDVEGGEMLVFEGAKNLIQKDKPILIFEHGLGASEFYDGSPAKLFAFFKSIDYAIFTLDKYLKESAPLNEEALKDQFYNRKNYYFIASPL